MRTDKAQELLEVAYMLTCFFEHGAPMEQHLLSWARKIVWMNGGPA